MYSAEEIKTAMKKYIDSTGDTSIDEQSIIDILDEGTSRSFDKASRIVKSIRKNFGIKRKIPEWLRMLTFRLIYDDMFIHKDNRKQEDLLAELGFNKKVFDGTSWQMYSPSMKLRQIKFTPVDIPFTYTEVESNPIYVVMLHHLISEARVATNTFIDVFGRMGYIPAFCAGGYTHRLIFRNDNESYLKYYYGITTRPTKTYKVLQRYMKQIEKVLDEKLGKKKRDEKIRSIVSDASLMRGLYSSDLSEYAAAKFCDMCFRKPYWEERNIVKNSDEALDERFIIDDYSSIKRAKKFIGISKEDFVNYANALKKVEYKGTTDSLLDIFSENINAVNIYDNYDFDKELGMDLEKIVYHKKPLLYVDAPKYDEFIRFDYSIEKHIALIESLLYYEGDWILTWKDFMFNYFRNGEKKDIVKLQEQLRKSKKQLYIFSYKINNHNIRNGIKFITNIDFNLLTKQELKERYKIDISNDDNIVLLFQKKELSN